MHKITHIFLAFMLGVGIHSLWGQTEVEWGTLAQVTYDYIQNQDQNFWYGKPTFSEEVQKLSGQEIIIKGYMLPSDVNNNTYVLSAFPFSSCFFCGGSGPESVIELNLKKRKQKFKQDQVVTVSGILQLNDKELELNYILEEVEIVNIN